MTEPHLTTLGVAHERGALLNADPRQVSWGAIFAGVVIALVFQLLMNLLGAGIGAAVIDPATGDNPSATSFSLATAGWFIASGVIAAFVGGFVASRLSGKTARSIGALHGLTTWAVTTLLIVYLLTTSIGALVGGAFSGLGGILSGAGSTVATAATTAADPIGTIEQSVRQASGGNDPAALRDTAIAAVRAALTGDQAKANEARNRAADALARAQNISVDQARQQVAQYEEQYKQAASEAKRRAAEAAQTATKSLSVGAITAVVALVLGAIAAWVGGAAGTVTRLRHEVM